MVQYRIPNVIITLFIVVTLSILCDESRAQVQCTVDPDRVVRVLFPDAIPSIQKPTIVQLDQFEYPDDEKVVGVEYNGEARAYPHQILWWHEIINDALGELPISITLCPLTGTSIVFRRSFADTIHTLGVSGNLFNSNLVMYSKTTQSLFPQMCATGISGENQNVTIQQYPSIETTWGVWKSLYPNTTIVNFETGHVREYNLYPYESYRTDHDYMLFSVDPEDMRLNRKDYVYGLEINGEARAYPFQSLPSQAAVNDELGGEKVLIIFDKTSQTAWGYARQIDVNQELTFEVIESQDGSPFYLRDQQTNSIWTLTGKAISGSWTGRQLESYASGYTGFWFAWAAFYPGIEIFDGVVTDIEEEKSVPVSFHLSQNFPNPFNPSTTIQYEIPGNSDVTLRIYNMLGQEIRTLVQNRQSPGAHTALWDGTDAAGQTVASGVYLYALETPEFNEVRKMILLR